MPTAYPAGLDTFANPGPSDLLNNAVYGLRHSVQHGKLNDAVAALQVKIGIDNSPDPASLDYKVAQRLPLAGGVLTGNLQAPRIGLGLAPAYPLHATSTGQTAFLVSTPGSTDDKHTLTVSNSGGDPALVNSVALNAINNAENCSTIYASGANKTRSVVKVSHAGYADGSDSSASCIGIDPNPSVAGSRANGLSIIPTVLCEGNLIQVRGRSGVEDFAIRGISGYVGIGVPTAHTPRGIVEIAQQQLGAGTAVPALFIQADTGSTQQLILCRDSGGSARFEVASSGAAVHRATSFFTSSIQVGSASSDLGGGTAVISLKHATVLPTSNPTGGVLIYADSNALKTRDPNGRISTLLGRDNAYGPSDRSLLGWAYDPAVASATTSMTNGTLFLVRLNVREAATITNLIIGLATGATTPTAGQNFLGLYDSTGALVASTASTALDTPSATSGVKSIALSSPYAAAAGEYWVGILMNAATPAASIRGSGSSLTIANLGSAASAYRFAVNGTGLTALPASFNPASNSLSGAAAVWAAAS